MPDSVYVRLGDSHEHRVYCCTLLSFTQRTRLHARPTPPGMCCSTLLHFQQHSGHCVPN